MIHFDLDTIPLGIMSLGESKRCLATAVGDKVIDLSYVANEGLFDEFEIPRTVFYEPTINLFMGLGKEKIDQVRQLMIKLIARNDSEISNAYFEANEVKLHLPFHINNILSSKVSDGIISSLSPEKTSQVVISPDVRKTHHNLVRASAKLGLVMADNPKEVNEFSEAVFGLCPAVTWSFESPFHLAFHTVVSPWIIPLSYFAQNCNLEFESSFYNQTQRMDSHAHTVVLDDCIQRTQQINSLEIEWACADVYAEEMWQMSYTLENACSFQMDWKFGAGNQISLKSFLSK